MKILHISYSDQQGGAAIAAYRHHEAMRRLGIDSKMLVLNKMSNDPNVIEYRPSFFSKYIPKIYNRIISRTATYYASWSYSKYGCDFSNEESVRCADIIILHWVNRYTLSLRSIANILKSGKKIYWFMHDMWPITGGCHHSLECKKYAVHCGACPMANNHNGSGKEKDLSYQQFKEKLTILKGYDNLKFVTPSQWLADRVKESSLFSNNEVYVVRNIVDTNVFKPIDKINSRKSLGLPLDKKLILFGADNVLSPYKGWKYLKNALQKTIPGVEVVVYGMTPGDIREEISAPMYVMGHIGETEKLVNLYSACDVFITTSVAENYPNVLLEAMACGLPCIGTNIGGIPEIIKDGENGKIVPLESEIIRETIIELINNKNYSEFSVNAIKQIRKNNSYKSLEYLIYYI